MNLLRSKEIHLMLPAYLTALALAVAPMWLLTNRAAENFGSTDIFQVVATYPLCFGLVLLALSCFGREFSMNTFQLLLAQPLERQRIWRTKIGVLTAGTTTIFVVWGVSWIARVLFLHSAALDAKAVAYTIKPFDFLLFAVAGTTVLAVFSGGLWTTLLLRQVTAPFWFTVLLPATIVMVVEVFGGNNAAVFIALIIYSVAGFWLARRIFFSAQEIAWTGGIFVLPGLRPKNAAQASNVRSRRPWMAMVRKEFQLHQVGLAGIAVLFAVHLGTLLFHHGGLNDKLARTASTVSDLCSFLWCMVPLFIGATSVAEERKMGMIEGHLCLPVSSRVQLAIKLAFVVVFGGLVTAVLFWMRMNIGHSMTGISDYVELKLGDRAGSLAVLSGLLTGIALLAFYASTLSRNLMQALVAGVIAVVVVWGLAVAVEPPYRSWLEGIWPWEGELVYFIGAITLVFTLIALAYRNFRQLPDSRRLWRRNLIGWSAALLFAGTATAAMYNRAWEFLTPLEPAHGPARITGTKLPVLRGDSFRSDVLSLLLPDGRLWVNRIVREPNWSFTLFDQPYSLGMGGKWISLTEKPFVAGSNWVDAFAGYYDTAAIRADATLWVSGQSRNSIRRAYGPFPTDKPDTLIQVGNATDWKSMVSVESSWASLLLKTDGSLWQWDSLSFEGNKLWPGLRTFEPYRLGTESDWADILSAAGWRGFSGETWLYAWDKSGQAWALTGPFNRSAALLRPKGTLAPGKGLERRPILDRTKWRDIVSWAPQWTPFQAGVRDDGTLWVWDGLLQGNTNLAREFVGKIAQMDHETNWVAVASSERVLVALKADGTLWRWNEKPYQWPAPPDWPAETRPVRVGTHHDWVAVAGANRGIVSLAADGSLWYWWTSGYWDSGVPLLAASRKPVKLGNIFDKE